MPSSSKDVVGDSSCQNGRVIKSTDFSFVGYKKPNRLFNSSGRSYQICAGSPDFRVLKNVVYIPATRSFYPFDGCLYDEDLCRIDESCIVRGANDTVSNTNPKHLARGTEELPVFEGSVIYLGYINKHYGHFLIESLARMWAILGPFRGHGRVLLHFHDESVLRLPFVQDCFRSVGLTQENIISFNVPTVVKEVILPRVAFQLDSHLYEAYKDITSGISNAHHHSAGPRSAQPLYISRRLLSMGVKWYQGEAELEEFLMSRGVKIMHPQLVSFEQQIQAFNKHDLILGITGSGMHNLVFSRPPVASIQFSGSSIPASYFLIDSCFDVRSTFFNSTPGIELLNRIASSLRRRQSRLARTFPFSLLRRPTKFRVTETLDYPRIIAWLKSSRIV